MINNKNITANKTITVIRTIAMFLIILCHYVSWISPISFLGQVFNVGVPLFFIISGYLYGQKTIENVLLWYRKQLIKIVIPVYIYYLLIGVVLFLFGKFGTVNAGSAVKQLLCLKGVIGGEIGNIETGHLWFISFMLVCYLITPILQLLRGRGNKAEIVVLIMFFSVLDILFMLMWGSTAFLFWIPGIIAYMIAYFIGAFLNREFKKKLLFLMTFIMLCSLIVRIITKLYADGTRLYDNVVFEYSQCILAFWIFFFLYWLCERQNNLLKQVYPVAKLCDKYSYEVYIVHNVFLTGALSLRGLTDNLLINTVAFIVLTVSCSVLLHHISTIIKKQLA